MKKVNIFRQQFWRLTLSGILFCTPSIPQLSNGSAYAQTQLGKASFYSRRATGARTANGERLHHDSLTCAHKTYPFGTMLKVTNPANQKTVVVRVTDRGPYVKGRIIDLSVRAARELGIIAQGIAPVIVERYDPGIIPFKHEDIELPELEISTNEGSDTKPIWIIMKELHEQQQKERDAAPTPSKRPNQSTKGNTSVQTSQTNKSSISSSSSKSSNSSSSSQSNNSNSPSKSSSSATKEKTSDELLHEINHSPNKSKAYQKRQGRSR